MHWLRTINCDYIIITYDVRFEINLKRKKKPQKNPGNRHYLSSTAAIIFYY